MKRELYFRNFAYTILSLLAAVNLTFAPKVDAQTSEVQNSESNMQTSMDESARASLGNAEQDEQGRRIMVSYNVESNREISAADRRSISLAAERLLMHVEQARASLSTNNLSKAKEEVRQALTLSRIIESNAPSYTIETNISSGDIQYTDKNESTTVSVPVFGTLGRASVVAPLINAKRSESGEAKNVPVVKDTELFATRISLDLENAKTHLQAAEQEINNGNLEQAQNALTAVQQGVMLSYVEMDLPLVRAGQNLALANLRAEAGKKEEVSKALRAATNSLEVYEKSAGHARAKEIQNLRKEISSALNKPVDELSSQIDGWQDELSSFLS